MASLPGGSTSKRIPRPVSILSTVDTVKARAAEGEERSRLWDRWREIDTNLDAYAALRSGETAVVILEPSPDANG